jgi:hypothetical protein
MFGIKYILSATVHLCKHTNLLFGGWMACFRHGTLLSHFAYDGMDCYIGPLNHATTEIYEEDASVTHVSRSEQRNHQRDQIHTTTGAR